MKTFYSGWKFIGIWKFKNRIKKIKCKPTGIYGKNKNKGQNFLCFNLRNKFPVSILVVSSLWT